MICLVSVRLVVRLGDLMLNRLIRLGRLCLVGVWMMKLVVGFFGLLSLGWMLV